MCIVMCMKAYAVLECVHTHVRLGDRAGRGGSRGLGFPRRAVGDADGRGGVEASRPRREAALALTQCELVVSPGGGGPSCEVVVGHGRPDAGYGLRCRWPRCTRGPRRGSPSVGQRRVRCDGVVNCSGNEVSVYTINVVVGVRVRVRV